MLTTPMISGRRSESLNLPQTNTSAGAPALMSASLVKVVGAHFLVGMQGSKRTPRLNLKAHLATCQGCDDAAATLPEISPRAENCSPASSPAWSRNASKSPTSAALRLSTNRTRSATVQIRIRPTARSGDCYCHLCVHVSCAGLTVGAGDGESSEGELGGCGGVGLGGRGGLPSIMSLI
jgi:hypothetical protein